MGAKAACKMLVKLTIHGSNLLSFYEHLLHQEFYDELSIAHDRKYVIKCGRNFKYYVLA